MTANAPPRTPLPTRGVPGGWKDPWEWLDRLEELALRDQAIAAERHRQMELVLLRRAMQHEKTSARRR